MASKTRTILRRKPKALGGKVRTGQKAKIGYHSGSSKPPGTPLTGTVLEASKADLAQLRIAVPVGLKQDLEEIVFRLGLWANVSELARSTLLRERDKRIRELRQVQKKEAEKETGP
jgi:hypothetical protein